MNHGQPIYPLLIAEIVSMGLWVQIHLYGAQN